MRQTNQQPDGGNLNLAVICLAVLATALAFVLAAGCGADNVSGSTTSCNDHTDCPYGTVCNASGQCVGDVDCQFCDEDDEHLVCDDGICTVRCTTDEDCDEGQCVDGVCGGQPADSCSSDTDCPDGYECNPFSDECEPEDNSSTIDCQNNTDCDGDDVCEDGQCVPDGSGGGEDCDLEAADCTGDTPFLDDQSCQCVECAGSADCDGDDEQCVDGFCTDDDGGGGDNGGDDGCVSGQTCGAAGGSCGGDYPYCIDDCCVECIGAADCDGDDICTQDGVCGSSSGCTDESDCPVGYDCDNGQCVAPDAGASCSSDADCPDGQFCDPSTSECVDLGGDMGCGMCNDDCTCDHPDLTCDGFMCVGCTWLTGGECGDDEWCWPAEDFDMADENFCGPQLM